MTNKVFYSLIAVIVFLSISVGVYAFTDDNSGNPRVMGHSPDEIGVPDNCEDGQILKVIYNEADNLVWGCDDEGYSSVDWNEITGIPAGFADGIDAYAANTDTRLEQDIYTSGWTSYGSCKSSSDADIARKVSIIAGGCPTGYSFSRLNTQSSRSDCSSGWKKYSYQSICIKYWLPFSIEESELGGSDDAPPTFIEESELGGSDDAPPSS